MYLFYPITWMDFFSLAIGNLVSGMSIEIVKGSWLPASVMHCIECIYDAQTPTAAVP